MNVRELGSASVRGGGSVSVRGGGSVSLREKESECVRGMSVREGDSVNV